MKVGKQLQFFGARQPRESAVYAINGGRDEITGAQVGPEFSPAAEVP